MSAPIGVLELLVCGFVAVLVFGGFALFVARMNRDSGTSSSREAPMGAPAPRASSVIFWLRFFGDEDETYVQQILGRHSAIRSAAAAREAALDLVRAAPSATHAWLGPAAEAPEGEGHVRCGLPGGIVVGFRADSRGSIDTVRDDANLALVVQELRKISAWTDASFAGASLGQATPNPGSANPPLRAVKADTRPGMSICAYCGHANPAYETACANCGARASA